MMGAFMVGFPRLGRNFAVSSSGSMKQTRGFSILREDAEGLRVSHSQLPLDQERLRWSNVMHT